MIRATTEGQTVQNGRAGVDSVGLEQTTRLIGIGIVAARIACLELAVANVHVPVGQRTTGRFDLEAYANDAIGNPARLKRKARARPAIGASSICPRLSCSIRNRTTEVRNARPHGLSASFLLLRDRNLGIEGTRHLREKLNCGSARQRLLEAVCRGDPVWRVAQRNGKIAFATAG